MMTPLNRIYGARETRSWTRRLLVSLGGAFLVIVCLFSAGVVVLAGRLVHAHGPVEPILSVVRWLLALVLLLATIAVIIRVVPAKKRPFRWVSIGSLLSALCWVGATIGFGAYISTVSYSSFYGGLGSAILLLIYLHVSAIAFLLGVSVDSQLRAQERRMPRRGRARTPVGT
jgi:membrane protein